MKKLSINYFKKSTKIESDKNTEDGGGGIKYFTPNPEKIFSALDLWNIHRKRKTVGVRRNTITGLI